MQKKVKIHEFNPLIYPCRIWVSINPSLEEVSKQFYALTLDMERTDFNEDSFSHNRFKIATTMPVSRKKDGWIGLLVCIWKPKQFNVKDICHESAHCCDFISERFGITTGSFENGEAYAYFIGWIADCINQVKTGKIKKGVH